MDEIIVSVLMGVYNQRDDAVLSRAVASILNQTLKKLELIIYDDGSDPETGAYIRKLAYLDPRIRVCGDRHNHGLAFALNACVDLARGRYLARMDADDVSAPERLERQYEFLKANPKYDWCGTNAQLFEDKFVWGCRRMPEEPSATDYLKYSPFIHPTVMFRREILVEHPYTVSRKTRRCEDYELFLRLWRQGYHGYNLQESLFYYREDRNSFRRRSMGARIHEAEIRFHNFREMRLLFPVGWAYVLRPVAGGLAPNRLLAWLKRRESGYGRDTMGAAASVLPEAAEEESPAVSGME